MSHVARLNYFQWKHSRQLSSTNKAIYNWWRPIAPSAIARRVIAVQTCSIIIITWHLVGRKIALQHILASLSTRPQSVVLRPRRLFQPQFSFPMKLPKDRREDKNLIKAKASQQFGQSGFTFFNLPASKHLLNIEPRLTTRQAIPMPLGSAPSPQSKIATQGDQS